MFALNGLNNAYNLNCLRQTVNGEYIAVFDNYVSPNEIYALQIDANGNFQWCKKYNPAGNDFVSCIQQTNDGGFVILEYSFYIIKTDINGISGCNETTTSVSVINPSIIVSNPSQPTNSFSITSGFLSSINVNNPSKFQKLHFVQA